MSSGYLPAITFATAPAAGVAITADFGVLWLCRFADDVQDFEEFMAQLFEAASARHACGSLVDDGATGRDATPCRLPLPRPLASGLGWSVHKKPVFSTIVASHVSGREVRDALYQNPIWQFELTFDGLDSTSSTYPGLGANSLQSLMGFFLQCQGQYCDLPLRRPDRQRGN